MITANDLRYGTKIELDGDIYMVVKFQHTQPGKGGAFMHTKLKNLSTGAIVDKTFRSEQKLQEVTLDRRAVQYLYKQDNHYNFMDNENYDQYTLAEDMVGDIGHFLKEGGNAYLVFYKGNPIDVELPVFVELEVIEAPPSFKGDTVTAGNKPVTLETGAVVNVPMFINAGDIIKVDTRTGEYVERVKLGGK